MSGEGLISVCLLTYNHAHVIESTMAAIAAQTQRDIEIIASDDCSTDGTWEKILKMAGSDRRMRPIRTPVNLGMPGNANFAVSQSQRPYVALLHHDDLCREDMLEKWLRIMERHPDCGFVFNAYAVHSSPRVYSHALEERTDGRHFLERYLWRQWGCPARGTALISRRLWRRLGGMKEEFGLLADVDLWMRIAACAAVGYVPEPLITIRTVKPKKYPKAYRESVWSWRRQRYLYEIHAANRLAHIDQNTIAGKFGWWRFRARLSGETAKWMVYGVVRSRPEMILNSGESATGYDLWPLKAFRRTLLWIYGAGQ